MSGLPNFDLELKKLNPEQLEAVKKIEGPMMVLAGPGTGKTQVVAMRIGQILRKTQLDPKNILALTFTEAGTTALRSRVVALIGSPGYQVGIYTFHGFASEVIGTFPYVFARTQELEQLNEADRFLLLEKILADHPEWDLLRPLRSPSQFIKEFGAQIKTCKQEAVSPENLKLLAQQLPELKSAKKIELEQAERDKTRLLQFAELYAEYERAMEQSRYYDYEDLILLVIKALEENPEVRAFFQEKYQYLLVDEYQDTNNAQNRLVEVLADFFENPNLFVVGDDKQAIMRFQGASVANMLHFATKYPSLETVTLTKNYRSTPEILTVADQLISYNHVQIQQYLPELSAKLVSTKKSSNKPEQLIFPSRLAEWTQVVELLQRAAKTGTPWSEMAVLVRRNDRVRAFRDFAQALGLPIAGIANQSIISSPVVQTLVQCLRAVTTPSDNLAVYSLARLLVSQTNRLKLFEEMASSKNRASRLIDRLIANKNLAGSAKTIMDWHQRLELLDIKTLLLELLDTTQLVERTASQRQLEQLEVLKAFLGLAEEFSRRNTGGVYEFISYLSTMETHQLAVEVQRIAAVQAGVHLSTLHKAKGLEFELVVLLDTDDHNYQIRPSRNLIKLPGLLSGIKNWRQDATDDERRLFYVGITRAKSKLYLTSSSQSDDGRTLLPCQFVEESGAALVSTTLTPSPATLTKALKSSLKPANKKVIDAEALSYVRSRVVEQPFSATALHAYQICPRQYLLTQVLKFSQPSSPALLYGNAVHKALELFGRDHRLTKKLPGVDILINYFVAAVTQTVLSSDQAATIGKGTTVLEAYYQKVLKNSPAPLHCEYSFSSHRVMQSDIWLTGKFDRIELLDAKTKRVRVIDYKTSSTAKTRNAIEGITKDSDGSIKQQLVFYSLLAGRSRMFPYQIGEYVVEFIDDKLTFRREVFQISEVETKALAKTIETTHKQILARTDFTHTRSEFDKGCELCGIFPEL